MSLPFVYEEYDFKAEKFLTGLTVENYIRPRLKVRWPELKISASIRSADLSVAEVC
jgi:hypothetical protein